MEEIKKIKADIQENNDNCNLLETKILSYVQKEKRTEFYLLIKAYYHAVGTLNMNVANLMIAKKLNGE